MGVEGGGDHGIARGRQGWNVSLPPDKRQDICHQPAEGPICEDALPRGGGQVHGVAAELQAHGHDTAQGFVFEGGVADWNCSGRETSGVKAWGAQKQLRAVRTGMVHGDSFKGGRACACILWGCRMDLLKQVGRWASVR